MEVKAKDVIEQKECHANRDNGDGEDDVKDGYEKIEIETITEIFAKTNLKRKLLEA